jgi:hypothetical protein
MMSVLHPLWYTAVWGLPLRSIATRTPQSYSGLKMSNLKGPYLHPLPIRLRPPILILSNKLFKVPQFSGDKIITVSRTGKPLHIDNRSIDQIEPFFLYSCAKYHLSASFIVTYLMRLGPYVYTLATITVSTVNALGTEWFLMILTSSYVKKLGIQPIRQGIALGRLPVVFPECFL